MDEQFETRNLIPPTALRPLLVRRTWPSALRLTLHFAAFLCLMVLLARHATQVWLALPLAVALAWVWSGLFAPFHECTHRTAFRTPRGNRLGAWLSGIPFGMAPLVYRVFHYEHHRHTQDVERDPELTNPAYAHWPDTPRGWLIANSGYGLIRLKLDPLLGFALKPRAEWPRFAPWSARIDDPDRVVFECRVLLGIWIAFLAGTLWLPGGIWFWFAAWFTHVFQTLWVASEHTGLPHEGSILARTRSVTSTPFVRWWLWNMNYHAEHHGWPAVPWHQLPATHVLVSNHLESLVPGYSDLQLGVLAGRKLPRGDP
jgi:fatty acid desaturase